ncbi:MAG: hypothetical protein ACREBE_12700, partial [bacterium]
ACGAARAAVLQVEAPIHPEPLQFINLDFDVLAKVPELSAEVARLRDYVATAVERLLEAQSRFEKELQRIVDDHLQRPFEYEGQPSRPGFTETLDVMERCLGPWVETRTVLFDEGLRFTFADDLDVERSQAMLNILERMRNIRRFYAVIEVVGPVLLAWTAIIFAALR